MADTGGVAYYLRLSRADGDLGADGKNESNSIENQRRLLEEYQSRSAELGGDPRLRYRPGEPAPPHVEYADDGCSGLTFDRPGFQRLLADCRKGAVSTILVKDMSRLGRDYIEVGDYVEQIFPMLGVRLIAVTERFDTGASAGMDFGVAVENLVNTFYVKDCAKKARAARRAKWKDGALTSRKTPIGYVCDDLREGWKVDPGGAEIVRTVFAEAEKGHGTGAIADALNSRGVPTPYEYLKGIGRGSGPRELVTAEGEILWNAATVSRILRNESYTGTLVQGKRSRVVVGGRQTRTVPDGERYRTEGAHEPIVGMETFLKAQEAIRGYRKPACAAGTDFALKGIVRCGNCRRVMNFDYGAYGDTLNCRARRVAKSGCRRESIPYGDVERAVLAAVRQAGALCGRLLERAGRAGDGFDEEAADGRIRQAKARKTRSYEEYASGLLTREQFLAEKEALSGEIEGLEREIAEARERREREAEREGRLAAAKAAGEEAAGTRKLTREMAEGLIRAVYVYDAGHVEVEFKCDDAIREAMEEYGLEAGEE